MTLAGVVVVVSAAIIIIVAVVFGAAVVRQFLIGLCPFCLVCQRQPCVTECMIFGKHTDHMETPIFVAIFIVLYDEHTV